MAGYDVLVIGGGVNGSGVARDCALRGMRTLLVDKHDICHGASGANTGMIHGGARYLLYDVQTAKDSCTDSGYIQRIAPHLLFRIPFLVPFFKHDAFAELVMAGADMFFAAYDHYQPLKRGKTHTRLTRDEALALEPGLTPDIIGAVTMDEWGIDPFRLVIGNAVSAREAGADVRTYTEVTGLLRGAEGRVTGATLRDALTGEVTRVEATVVVNSAGAWAPQLAAMAGARLRLRPGKGVHVVYSHRVSNYAFITLGVDGRQMFLMPHENGTICGTTDDDYYGDLDRLIATEDEVGYIRECGERVLPALKQLRMQRCYVGVRPTLFKFGVNEDALSRAHQVFNHAEDGAPGFFTLAGGKLASFRQFAQEATDEIAAVLQNTRECRTHLDPLPGGESAPDVEVLSRQFRWPLSAVGRVAYRHGSRARRVVEHADHVEGGRCVVCTCEPVTAGEIAYVAQHEQVRRLADVRRRTRLGMGACQGARCLVRGAAVLIQAQDRPAQDVFDEVRDALTARWRGMKPVMEGPNMAVAELSQYVHLGVGALHEAWQVKPP
ncbi:MAG: FAD-dependent oxidoreductase [Deltaproteobacteria bacterium]|nr:FAD-dependent oxidoreductase [Deltaproteobacteria bacterium]